MGPFDWSYSVAGVATGFLIGMTGVGGGALMTPLLLLIFGVAPHAAVGTDLWFAAITKSVAAKTHHNSNLIDWVVVRRLWMGSLPVALCTVVAMKQFHLNASVDRFLSLAIGFVVLITAIGMSVQPIIHAKGKQLRLTDARKFKAVQPVLTVLLGVILGMLVTLTSIGAGTLGAVVLTYLYPLRLTSAKLVATDITHSIPLTILAGIGHLWAGNVNGQILISLLLGSVPAVIFGSYYAKVMPDLWLKAVIAVALGLVGIKLIF